MANQQADSALMAIVPVPTDYTTWTELTIAYKAAGGDFETWDRWSATGANYDPKANPPRKKWDGIKETGRITAGTLYAEAKKHGWTWTAADPASRYRREYTRPRKGNAEEKPEVKPQTAEQIQNTAAYIAATREHTTDAMAYCKARGLDADTVKRFGIGYDPKRGEVVIPYPATVYYVARNPKISPNGKDDGGKNKYRYPTEAEAGEKPLFNIPALNSGADFVCITEGQIDAITLEQAGAAAHCGDHGYT